MKFTCYSSWRQLSDSANTLFEQAENDSLFFSRHWFECLSNSGHDGDLKLLLACVAADDDVLAMLPLLKGDANTAYALKHRYTPVYSFLLADADQQSVLACLAQGLCDLPLNGLVLDPVAENDQKMIALQRAMESVGFACEYSFRHYNWIYQVHGQSFAEYMASRPAKLRNTIARKQRKLAREHDVDIQLFRGDDVPQAMTDYYTVYRSSWKANEQYTDFVDDLVARFSRAGLVRLGILYIDGQPSAAQLWFVQHDKAYIFRLAYDEAWKTYSPGSILTHFLMQHVIDIDKVQEIDFLTGNEAYKQDWMSTRRECVALSCVKKQNPSGWFQRLVTGLKRLYI